jgi:hypothetical protein
VRGVQAGGLSRGRPADERSSDASSGRRGRRPGQTPVRQDDRCVVGRMGHRRRGVRLSAGSQSLQGSPACRPSWVSSGRAVRSIVLDTAGSLLGAPPGLLQGVEERIQRQAGLDIQVGEAADCALFETLRLASIGPSRMKVATLAIHPVADWLSSGTLEAPQPPCDYRQRRFQRKSRSRGQFTGRLLRSCPRPRRTPTRPVLPARRRGLRQSSGS